MRYKQHVTGHAAEQFVCYDLARRGLRVVSTPFEMGPFDVLADHRGTLLRLQVKGAAGPRQKNNGSGKTETYRFDVAHSQLPHTDLVAFVALDSETVVYKPPQALAKHAKSIWIPVSRMRAGCDAALLELLGEVSPG